MNAPRLHATVKRSAAGVLEVRAPKVGWWSDAPHVGSLLGPASRLGTLRQLNCRFQLVLPAGVAGRVSGGLPDRRVVPVEFGQLLFRLAAVGVAEVTEEDPALLGRPQDADLPEGSWAIVSPSAGVFYRRPAPDADPFVSVGDKVRRGQPVAMVEVMKTFNQIVYGAAGLPEQAQVTEIRCADGDEVASGQILFVVV